MVYCCILQNQTEFTILIDRNVHSKQAAEPVYGVYINKYLYIRQFILILTTKHNTLLNTQYT